jgi:diguanylate cyclase (GGDEF)-like protein/PAS domain S-box-containing protein
MLDLAFTQSLLSHPAHEALFALAPDGSVLADNAPAQALAGRALQAALQAALARGRVHLAECPDHVLAMELDLDDGPRAAELRTVRGADGAVLGYTLSIGGASGTVALAPEHARWRYALEHAEDGLWDWSAETGRVFRSARCLGMLGYREGEIAETTDAWNAHVHPEDREHQSEAIREHIAGGSQSYTVEYRARHRDGHWLWILDRGKVLTWTADGRPSRVIGIHTDITAYKELEGRLREHELLLAEAQRIGRIGSWAWNPVDESVWWSHELHRMVGWPAGQRAPRWAEQKSLYPPASYERLRQAVMRALEEGVGFVIEVEVNRPDGGVLQVEMAGDVLVGPTGVGRRLVGLMRDITEEKLAHATARWHNDLLNRIAAMGKIGGLEYDLVTDRLQWTAENYRIHGMTPGSDLSMSALLPRFAPASRRRLRAALDRLRNGQSREESEELEFFADDGRRLVLRVTASVETVEGRPFRITGLTQDITAEREASERIEQLAHYDSLTGLPNRFLFQQRGSEAVRHAQQAGVALALLFVDLDRFKNVNDSLGHAAGDALLREAAARIKACVRGSDLVGRLGGDEFVVVLREVARPEDAARVAEKIIAAVGEPMALPAADVQIGASVGIALLDTATSDLEALMRASDTAMYAAKEAGRNTFRFYSDAFYEQVQRRVTLERELRQALARGELHLEYQPTIAVDGGEVLGIEALLRWTPADGEERSPVEFIPVAEDTGEIVPIGRWVIAQACRQARAWHEAGIEFERMAVNVSAVQLREADFAEQVIGLCRSAGWPPERLELELTESALMHDNAVLRRTFATLEAHGIRLSVDDFGTGFSNLNYLHRFPVQHLKIDRSFVRQMLGDAQVTILAQAIIRLGHALGLDVVAEGVETPEALHMLRRQGCDEAQGFLFTVPLAPDALEAWMRARQCGHRQTGLDDADEVALAE